MAVKFETPDFTKAFETFTKSIPTDTSMFDDAFKSASEFTGKYTDIMLGAAQKNVDLTAAWAKETLTSFDKLSKPVDEPKAYEAKATEVMTDLMQTTPEHISNYAEVAKKAQLDAIELVMAAGKKTSEAAKKMSKAA